jgi:hypothetical protein
MANLKSTKPGFFLRMVGIFLYYAGNIITILTICVAFAGAVKGLPRVFSEEEFSEAIKIVGMVVALGIGVLIVAYILRVLGKRAIIHGKKLEAMALGLKTDKDPGSIGPKSVLYLRSFEDDRHTEKIREFQLDVRGVPMYVPGLTSEEENMAAAMKMIGPMIALAKPHTDPQSKEALPQVGALRMHADDHSWKEKVTGFMKTADLVVIRVGRGENLWWEIGEAFKTVDMRRIVFLLPWNDDDCNYFLQHLPEVAPISGVPMIVDDEDNNLKAASVRGLLFFDGKQVPQFVPFKAEDGWAKRNPFRPIFQIALKRVCEEARLPWRPPPVSLFLVWHMFIALVRTGMLLTAAIFIAYMGFEHWMLIIAFAVVLVFLLISGFALLISIGMVRNAFRQFRYEPYAQRWIERKD